jgi:hypothetical protein
LDDFGRSGESVCVIIGKDLFAIDEDVERPRRAGTHFDGYTGFPLDSVLEAHGLSLDICSKEAALDLNSHDAPLVQV